jgi:penicillin amidase/acyl-homoserine-lactone acylase
VITATPLLRASAKGLPRPDPVQGLRNASNLLLTKFARLDPTWGQVNRLRRGDLDLPLSGGPDTMRDIEPAPRMNGDGTTTAGAGDSFTLISSWTRDGRWDVQSIVPYGSSTVASAPHYADQAPLFANNQFKQVPVTTPALLAEATTTERPGKRPPPRQADSHPQPAAPSKAALAVSDRIGVDGAGENDRP